jgi:manganese transport protein
MGEFANGAWLRAGSWLCAAFILALNIWLVWEQIGNWTAGRGQYRPLIVGSSITGALAFAALLVVITCWPWLRRAPAAAARVAVTIPDESAPVFPSRTYSNILVPLDHSDADQEALGNALALARMHGARIILLHVEEGVTSQMFGSLSSTAEIEEGRNYLANLVNSLRDQDVSVDVVVRHGKSPAREIAAAIRDLQPDLVIMASHGHRGLKDLIFGTTINSVRHRVKVPLLIVRGS